VTVVAYAVEPTTVVVRVVEDEKVLVVVLTWPVVLNHVVSYSRSDVTEMVLVPEMTVESVFVKHCAGGA
jgi:hypothetical protein